LDTAWDHCIPACLATPHPAWDWDTACLPLTLTPYHHSTTFLPEDFTHHLPACHLGLDIPCHHHTPQGSHHTTHPHLPTTYHHHFHFQDYHFHATFPFRDCHGPTHLPPTPAWQTDGLPTLQTCHTTYQPPPPHHDNYAEHHCCTCTCFTSTYDAWFTSISACLPACLPAWAPTLRYACRRLPPACCIPPIGLPQWAGTTTAFHAAPAYTCLPATWSCYLPFPAPLNAARTLPIRHHYNSTACTGRRPAPCLPTTWDHAIQGSITPCLPPCHLPCGPATGRDCGSLRTTATCTLHRLPHNCTLLHTAPYCTLRATCLGPLGCRTTLCATTGLPVPHHRARTHHRTCRAATHHCTARTCAVLPGCLPAACYLAPAVLTQLFHHHLEPPLHHHLTLHWDDYLSRLTTFHPTPPSRPVSTSTWPTTAVLHLDHSAATTTYLFTGCSPRPTCHLSTHDCWHWARRKNRVCWLTRHLAQHGAILSLL